MSVRPPSPRAATAALTGLALSRAGKAWLASNLDVSSQALGEAEMSEGHAAGSSLSPEQVLSLANETLARLQLTWIGLTHLFGDRLYVRHAGARFHQARREGVAPRVARIRIHRCDRRDSGRADRWRARSWPPRRMTVV
jgi:hypothetical protein